MNPMSLYLIIAPSRTFITITSALHPFDLVFSLTLPQFPPLRPPPILSHNFFPPSSSPQDSSIKCSFHQPFLSFDLPHLTLNPLSPA
jgi:hypothetical protein